MKFIMIKDGTASFRYFNSMKALLEDVKGEIVEV